MSNAVPSLPFDVSGTPIEAEHHQHRAAQQVLYGHAATLMGNGSFQYFRDAVVGKQIAELEAVCCDRSKTSSERDAAVNLLDELKKIRDWAETTMESTRAFLSATEPA